MPNYLLVRVPLGNSMLRHTSALLSTSRSATFAGVAPQLNIPPPQLLMYDRFRLSPPV